MSAGRAMSDLRTTTRPRAGDDRWSETAVAIAHPQRARTPIALASCMAGTRRKPSRRSPRVPAEQEALLLQSVYATPDDDAPRLVYADVLQQAGDPRGELIVLQ